MFLMQSVHPRRGELVELRTRVELGHLPLGDDPPLRLEPLERRLERIRLDLSLSVELLRIVVATPAVAVEWSENQSTERKHFPYAMDSSHMRKGYMKVVFISRGNQVGAAAG
jgi:hypothetical protein